MPEYKPPKKTVIRGPEFIKRDIEKIPLTLYELSLLYEYFKGERELPEFAKRLKGFEW